MKNPILKNITLSLAAATVLFVSTAYFITRIFELNYYNELRISVEERLEEMDLFAESLLLSMSQIGASADDSSIDSLTGPLFKKSDDLFNMAFIAATDGSIVIHSDPGEESRLNGNIALDEFTYNLEEIFYPLTHVTEDTVKRDYNILNQKIPFSQIELDILKKRVYSKIDRNGLLYSRKIRLKNKKLCSANVIISKTDIYTVVSRGLEGLSRLKLFIVLSCLFLSAAVGTLIFFLMSNTKQRIAPQLPESVILPELQVQDTVPPNYTVYEAPVARGRRVNPVIQDAIPIKKRGRQ